MGQKRKAKISILMQTKQNRTQQERDCLSIVIKNLDLLVYREINVITIQVEDLQFFENLKKKKNN